MVGSYLLFCLCQDLPQETGAVIYFLSQVRASHSLPSWSMEDSVVSRNLSFVIPSEYYLFLPRAGFFWTICEGKLGFVKRVCTWSVRWHLLSLIKNKIRTLTTQHNITKTINVTRWILMSVQVPLGLRFGTRGLLLDKNERLWLCPDFSRPVCCSLYVVNTQEMYICIFYLAFKIQGNSLHGVEPQVTRPHRILKLQILTQLRVAGGRQGRRNYWKGIVNLVNVKHHTKTTEHAEKVEEDTSRPHSRHHH